MIPSTTTGQPRDPIVAVAGASGYLGRNVVRELARRGARVVVLGRGPSAALEWREQCADVDAVLHLAAPTRKVDAIAIQETLAATRSLLDALPDRALRFVFAGSVARFEVSADAVEIAEGARVFTGSDLAQQDPYTQLKIAQEDLIVHAARARQWTLSVLRPSNVWDDEAWYQPCVGPMIGRVWLVVGPSRPLRLIHRNNCTTAFVEALIGPTGVGDAVNLDDGAQVTAWHYVTRSIDLRRHRFLPIPVPRVLFDAVAHVASFSLGMIAPGRRRPGLLRKNIRDTRFGTYRIDTSLVRATLDWRPDLRPYRIVANAA